MYRYLFPYVYFYLNCWSCVYQVCISLCYTLYRFCCKNVPESILKYIFSIMPNIKTDLLSSLCFIIISSYSPSPKCNEEIERCSEAHMEIIWVPWHVVMTIKNIWVGVMPCPVNKFDSNYIIRYVHQHFDKASLNMIDQSKLWNCLCKFR